jgi:hypothetical protein
MFSAILEKVERLERENAELRQSLNDLSRRLTTIESNKFMFDGIFDDFTFSQKLNEVIDEKVYDELNCETFAEYLSEAIDERVSEVIDEKIDDDVVCVGVDHSNVPQFVSKNVVKDIISKRIGKFREHVGQNNCVESYLIGRTRVFYIESLMDFKGIIKQFDLEHVIQGEHKFFYNGCFFSGIKITSGKTYGEGRRIEILSYHVDAGTPEQRKLFLQAFEDVGIKLLYNGKPVVM